MRAIAFVEALKGVVVLAAATGLLALVHDNLDDLGARLVQHSHLNPASRYPHIILDAIAGLKEPRLAWLAAGAAAYAVIRLVEAYGLYFEYRWAEWVAALSGALYVPIELVELVRHPSRLGLGVLAVNAVVVGVMAWALTERRRSGAAGAA